MIADWREKIKTAFYYLAFVLDNNLYEYLNSKYRTVGKATCFLWSVHPLTAGFVL